MTEEDALIKKHSVSNRRQTFRDAAIALSLANLFFLSEWIVLLDASYNIREKVRLYNFNNIAALLMLIVAAGACMFLAMTWARRTDRQTALTVARLSFALVFVLALWAAFGAPVASLPSSAWNPKILLLRISGYFNLNELRGLGVIILATGAWLTTHPYRTVYRLVATVGAVLAFLLFARDEIYTPAALLGIAVLILFGRWHQQLIAAVAGLLLILFPFFLFTLFQSVSLLGQLAAEPATGLPAGGAADGRRVVWLVFDELDYHYVFVNRPAALTLPEFDRLQAQSLSGRQAYPPADFTLMSMPALINGRMLSRAQMISPSELLIQYQGEATPVIWNSQQTVFTRARELGYNSALVGWYHPYDREIGRSVNHHFVVDAGDAGFFRSLVLHLQGPLSASPFLAASNKLEAQKAVWEREALLAIYGRFQQEAQRVAANSDFGVVMIHYPIPHPPGIYNRAKAAFEADAESSYLDNLALADRALGEVRRAMEETGVWEQSTVIVSSDHWWRPHIWERSRMWTDEDESHFQDREAADQRVPYFIKMAGQQSALTVDEEFNTVLTHDLIVKLLGGELPSVEATRQWILQARTPVGSPCLFEQVSKNR